MRVEAIYISPGHNFFGRSSQPSGEHPTVAVSEVECVAGHGLRGDRFFDHRPNYRGQVTFFSGEVSDALGEALNVRGKSPGVFRRNVITRGVDLNDLIGEEFEVQGIRFAGVAECSPCRWMDHAFAPGAEAWLKNRGGLRARILTSGTLRVSAATP